MENYERESATNPSPDELVEWIHEFTQLTPEQANFIARLGSMGGELMSNKLYSIYKQHKATQETPESWQKTKSDLVTFLAYMEGLQK